MTTTIAVKEDTLDLLREMREKLNTTTHDETIRKLVWEAKRPKKSMFGALKNIKAEFVREELDRFA